MNRHILMISGKMGSGKTTLDENIKKLFIKNKEMFNIRGWAVKSATFAEPLYTIHNFARGVLKNSGIEHPDHLKIKDGNLLQYLGTDWARKTYGENIWCKIAADDIDKKFTMMNYAENALVIISDMRFRNEFDYFREATKIRLECNEDLRKQRVSMWRENSNHPSEIDLDQYFIQGKFDEWYDSGNISSEDIAYFIVRDLISKVTKIPQSNLNLEHL